MRVVSGDVCTVVSSRVISRESLVAGDWSLVMGDATWLAVVLGGGPDTYWLRARSGP